MVYREHGSGMWPDAHNTNLFTGVNICIINMLRGYVFPLTDQHGCYCILNRTILIHDFIHFNCGFIYVLDSQGHNFYKLKYISLEEVKIVPFQQ